MFSAYYGKKIHHVTQSLASVYSIVQYIYIFLCILSVKTFFQLICRQIAELTMSRPIRCSPLLLWLMLTGIFGISSDGRNKEQTVNILMLVFHGCLSGLRQYIAIQTWQQHCYLYWLFIWYMTYVEGEKITNPSGELCINTITYWCTDFTYCPPLLKSILFVKVDFNTALLHFFGFMTCCWSTDSIKNK